MRLRQALGPNLCDTCTYANLEPYLNANVGSYCCMPAAKNMTFITSSNRAHLLPRKPVPVKFEGNSTRTLSIASLVRATASDEQPISE